MNNIREKIVELSQKYDLTKMGYRQIGRIIGVEHPQTIKYHLEKLGILKNSDKSKKKLEKQRSYNSKLVSVPILGLANCGDATMFADSTLEGNLTLSPKILPIKKFDSLFAVRAVGSSMNKADVNGENIEDGDYVIVNGNDRNVKTGDYVLSVIGGLANIKKYVENKSQKQVALISESKTFFPPIYLHEDDLNDYLVNGKVISVIKPPKEDDIVYEPI